MLDCILARNFVEVSKYLQRLYKKFTYSALETSELNMLNEAEYTSHVERTWFDVSVDDVMGVASGQNLHR